MPTSTLQVLIDIKSKLEGLEQAVAQMRALKAEADAVARAAGEGGFASLFKIGESIDLTQRFNQAVAEIPLRLKEWISQGIEFNSELQKTQTAIAGLFKQEAPGQFATFEQAKSAASDTIELLKAKANELGISYADMFETFEHAQAQLAAGGVKNIKEQIDLIALLNRAMQSLGISSQNAARDIGDILQGQGSRTLGGGRLAAAIGVSKEELDQMILEFQQSGTLAQGLRDRLGGIADSMAGASQTFNADANRMKNAIFDLKAAATQPIMEPLTQAIEVFTAILKDDDVRAWARTAGDVIKDVADFVAICTLGWKAMGNAISGVSSEISGLLAPLKSVAAAIDANPVLRSIFSGVKASLSATVSAGLDVLGPLGLAARAGTAIGGYLSDTVAKEKEIGAVLDSQNKVVELQVKTRAASKATLEEIKKIENDIALKRAEASGDKEAIAQAHAKTAYEDTLAAARAKLVPQKEAIALAEKERDATLEVYRAKGAQKDQHRDIAAFLREEEAMMQRIRQQQQLISQNPFLDISEKNALSASLIRDQIEQINRGVQTGRALLSGGSLDPATYEQVAIKVNKAAGEVELLKLKLEALSFTGELRADLVTWVSSFGTAAHQVAGIITNTLNTAIQGTSQALTAAIFHTQSWRQSFAQAAQSIVQNIIQVVLQWVVARTVMSVLNRVFGQADAKAATSLASQAAAAWSAAAISASIATEGVAAGTGTIAYVAALATGQAAAIGASSFETGGYTGSAGSKTIAGIVHGQEFVHPKSVVDHYGLPFMTAIYERRLPADQIQAMLGNYRYTPVTPRLGGFEVGGAVAAIDGSGNNGRLDSRESPAPVIKGFKAVVVNDMDQLKKEIFQSDEAVVWLINAINGNAHLIRPTGRTR